MTPEDFKKILKENDELNNKVLKAEINKDIKAELAKFKTELSAEVKKMVTESLTQVNEDISGLKKQIEEKDEVIAALQNRTLSLEFFVRSRSLVIFKVFENENETQSLKNGVSNLIRDIADSSFKECDVDEVYRLGKKGVRTTPRPIILRLKEIGKRNFLLSQKSKFIEKNVGIQEDLPKEVIEWRKPLFEVADAIRKEGRKVTFRRDKLLVDGVELNTEQIEEESKKIRKRGRSDSPGEGTSSGKRNLPRFTLPPATPKIQPSIEQFYSPAPSNMRTFEFSANEK